MQQLRNFFDEVGHSATQAQISMSQGIVTVWTMSTHANTSRNAARTIDIELRRTLTAELPPALRRLYRRVLEETLAQGVPVDAGAVAVVLSVMDENFEDPLHFAPERMEELLWFAVTAFCDSFGLAVPGACAEALFAIVAIGLACPTIGANAKDPEAIFGVLRQLS